MSKIIKKPSFQFSLGVLLFTTTLVTGLGVTLLNYNDAQKTVRELSSKIFEEVSDKVFSLINGNLDKAKQLGVLNEKMIRNFISDDQSLRIFLYDTLENFPEFTFVALGDEQGKMVSADKLTGELRARQWTQLGNGTSRVAEYRKDKKKPSELSFISHKMDTYDPRVRGWYQSAKKIGRPIWVDPYMWLPEKIPGITFAIPSPNEKGEIDRVLTVEIQLGFITEALRKFYHYKSGIAFITNEEGLLVAHNKLDSAQLVKDGESSLPHIDTIEDEQTHLVFKKWIEDGKSNTSNYYFQGKKFLLRSKELNVSQNISWYMLMSVAEKESLAKAFTSLYRSLSFSLAILIVTIAFSLTISYYLSKNFNLIFEEMKKIFRFSFEQTPRISSFVYEIDALSNYLSNIKSSLVSFKKYISPVLVKKYLLDGMEAKLGGEEKEVTIMFIDIENYTKISEHLPERELIALLNKFSMIITKNVEKFHGTVDKFIGDSIMNFWGGIDEVQNHALLACQCALKCYEDIKNSDIDINIRIGINTGKVVMGNFGSEERFNFTVLGDNVNQASRLESSNKIYKTNILISEATFLKVKDTMTARKIDDVILKGKNDAIAIYEINDATDDRQIKYLYEKALKAYQVQNWENAIGCLEEILALKTNDGPSLVLKERCQAYQKKSPGKDWDGIFAIEVK